MAAGARGCGPLDAAARAAGVSVVGTGVNPGFAMDFLPIVLSGAAKRVDSVPVHRVQDAGQRGSPLQAKVGAGISAEEFEQRVTAGRSATSDSPSRPRPWPTPSVGMAAGHHRDDRPGAGRTVLLVGVRHDRARSGHRHRPGRGRPRRRHRAGAVAPDDGGGAARHGTTSGWPETPTSTCPSPGTARRPGDRATLVNTIGSIRHAEPGLRVMSELGPLVLRPSRHDESTRAVGPTIAVTLGYDLPRNPGQLGVRARSSTPWSVSAPPSHSSPRSATPPLDDAFFAGVDGLVLPGGPDPHPSRCGASPYISRRRSTSARPAGVRAARRMHRAPVSPSSASAEGCR